MAYKRDSTRRSYEEEKKDILEHPEHLYHWDHLEDIFHESWDPESGVDFKDLIQIAEKILNRDPTNARMWYHLGRLREYHRDFQGAVDAFQKCTALEGKNLELWRKIGQVCFYTLRNFTEAARVFETIVALEPNDTLSQERLGISRLELGRYAGAIAVFEELMRSYPHGSGYDVPKYLGHAYFAVGEYLKAGIVYEKAAITGHLDAEGWANLGTFYDKTSRPGPALYCWEIAAQESHKDAKVWAGLARAHGIVPENPPYWEEEQKFQREMDAEMNAGEFEHLAQVWNIPVKRYQDTLLRYEEYRPLKSLSKRWRRDLPVVKTGDWDTFGCTVVDGHVAGIGLYQQGLRAIPKLIKNFSHLMVLRVTENKIRILPDWFQNLHFLQMLDLQVNRIKVLPDWIGSFQSLAVLILSENMFTSLPPTIGDLLQLTSLDLSHNQLSILPASIIKLKSLEFLNLGGNPWQPFSKEIQAWLGELRDDDCEIHV